ncbi:hypothetical protein [Actinoallomurus rhizosphaericola]|uniref:hypothetical protein n=1 Tax=Actinoallomurus rhizosphaericola TaxID=2952536 RepID=UPI0020939885|nr:hypothetical protein [Actinoallomurus rhizosphaericola]MCO5995408.1 hypothetical protein [Actinoallomurus rhizosphaericola]
MRRAQSASISELALPAGPARQAVRERAAPVPAREDRRVEPGREVLAYIITVSWPAAATGRAFLSVGE